MTRSIASGCPLDREDRISSVVATSHQVSSPSQRRSGVPLTLPGVPAHWESTKATCWAGILQTHALFRGDDQESPTGSKHKALVGPAKITATQSHNTF
ncbi:hypothetical protein RRG08_020710 [Elysia crispata]|uniref:Uncharacterized protein n=1 Tax=Elysia crispata TaxID=231223 RepID=A0AAE1B035_9GAST|nr:hypothetical protein RRG08_020710 [Elysia crispata]